MSVSLLVFKGEDFNNSKSKMITEVPVSFQNVWNETWEKLFLSAKSKYLYAAGCFQ